MMMTMTMMMITMMMMMMICRARIRPCCNSMLIALSKKGYRCTVWAYRFLWERVGLQVFLNTFLRITVPQSNRQTVPQHWTMLWLISAVLSFPWLSLEMRRRDWVENRRWLTGSYRDTSSRRYWGAVDLTKMDTALTGGVQTDVGLIPEGKWT